eukprot:6211430-Pleurochrysis_carterae.AAC.3
MSCKWLRRTNARYGGAGQQAPTPLSRGRAQALIQNFNEQPLKAARGSSRSLRPTLSDHARLSWRVLTYSDSLLPGSTRATIQAGMSEGIYKIRTVGGWEQTRARGLGANHPQH